jgi:GNAT superfamily N-acetyltransferase
MAHKPTIRTAQPNNARVIAEVHIASWKAAYTGLLPPERLAQLDIDERESAWRDRLANSETLQLRAWVATVDDRIVGFASTQPSADEDLTSDVHELTTLYLLPSVWRSGIGSILLSTAEDALRRAGIRSPSLWLMEGNKGAESFYETRSWKFDRRDTSFRDFGVAALRYRKQL